MTNLRSHNWEESEPSSSQHGAPSRGWWRPKASSVRACPPSPPLRTLTNPGGPAPDSSLCCQGPHPHLPYSPMSVLHPAQLPAACSLGSQPSPPAWSPRPWAGGAVPPAPEAVYESGATGSADSFLAVWSQQAGQDKLGVWSSPWACLLSSCLPLT